MKNMVGERFCYDFGWLVAKRLDLWNTIRTHQNRSEIRCGQQDKIWDLISVISLPKLLQMHLLDYVSRALSEKYVCHSGKNIGKICRAFA